MAMLVHDKCAPFEAEISILKKENEHLKLILENEIRELTERIAELEKAIKNNERL